MLLTLASYRMDSYNARENKLPVRHFRELHDEHKVMMAYDVGQQTYA